jgi:hypothetical protein
VAVNVKAWHARIAKIMGQLSLRIESKHLSKSELAHWADELASVADEMRRTAKGDKK